MITFEICVYYFLLVFAISTWHRLISAKWREREDARWIPAVLMCFLPGIYFATYRGMESLTVIIIQFVGFVTAFMVKKYHDITNEDNEVEFLRGKINDEIK